VKVAERDFHIILFGATGFTGRLVAEHLKRRAGGLTWAIAGRNRDKLEALGLGVPIIVADAMDPVAIGEVARRARVVCTTVGPYAKYGTALVAACAEAGTHYCDLTAEVQWMRGVIDRHHAQARATGARIVHACGFDSIPSDLGTRLVQEAFIARHGRPADKVTGFFGEAKGGVSGGTVASGMEMARAGAADRSVRRLMADPYALDPDPQASRPAAPDERAIGFDKELSVFTVPFVMAASNTRIVRRGHVLAGEPWGPGFVYREVKSLPGTPKGFVMSLAFMGGMAGMALTLSRPKLLDVAARFLPKPGEGPSEATRTSGYWRARFVAEGGGERLTYLVGDDLDPGYGSTSRMLGESALSLASDALTSDAGVVTPAWAMGEHLAARLRDIGFTLAVA